MVQFELHKAIGKMMNHPGCPSTSSQQITRPGTLLIPNTSSQFFAPQAPLTAVTSTMITSTPSLLNTPSGTTPLLLTPNTIKTIEQSILQTLGEDTEENFLIESQQYSGNFVPPLPSSTSHITLINTWQGGQVSSDCVKAESNNDPVVDEEDKMDVADEVIKPDVVKKKRSGSTSSGKRGGGPKRVGGRKPGGGKGVNRRGQKGSQNSNPFGHPDDERRLVRRERNKQAAARCRKRRVDHTNKLVEETEGLEAKKRALQNQITELQSQKEELEFLLEAHNCVKKIVKNEVLSDLQNLPKMDSTSVPTSEYKVRRPNSLNVINSSNNSQNINGPGIPISTPSTGISIAGLGFDSFPDWGVNTPSGNGDEDHRNNVPSDVLNRVHSPLVTPVMPFKRLQDL